MIFVLLVVLIAGIAALLLWNVMMFASNAAHVEKAAEYALRTNREKFEELRVKYEKQVEDWENAGFFERQRLSLTQNPKSTVKQAAKLKKSIDKLEGGNYGGINFLVLPGFGFIEMRKITADNPFFQNMIGLFSDLKGREHAVDNARYLLASMYSCAIGGGGAAAVVGALMFAAGNTMGLAVALGGPFVAVLLAYALFDGLRSKAKARKEQIMFDFAQVVTELALLTSSGMEMTRAWNEVCKSAERTGPLYTEMRFTSAEIERGLHPSAAFEGFIKRCGTKDVARLGASILQGLTRGNEELSRFLTELASETWEERKHGARRLGEKARSKLIIPMALIFMGILLVIGVAVISGMGQLSM